MIRLLKKLDKDDSNQVGLISPIIDQGKPDLTCENFSFVHPNFSTKYEGSKEQNIEVLRNRLSYWVGHYWFEFDEVYIKPRLCYQWPWTKENNMNLKNVIIKYGRFIPNEKSHWDEILQVNLASSNQFAEEL